MGAGCSNNCPTCKCSKSAIIIGAGLVGSLWAIYLSKAGYKVSIYERRSDMRLSNMSAGKSINLATSFRGWKALDEVGIGDEIRKMAIPMFGRTLHHADATLNYQPYGHDGQAIYSVSRAGMNASLMSIAALDEGVHFHFNEECVNVDMAGAKVFLKHTQTAALTEATADIVFATDGAFSSARYHGMQKLDGFNFSQQYIPDGYREILLPANADGTYKLNKETLHIWPRGRFMLIALPNFDGSFTCTLFMPFENEKYCFKELDTNEKVDNFFKEVFPDFFELMPNVAEEWDQHPLSSLAIIRCFPWTSGKLALMGDAAHATVPFFGQGMNCGFEDCSIMWQLMNKHHDHWEAIFKEYELMRKPNGDAVQDLSLQNYIVMRDKVADPEFLLLQKVERRMNALYPDSYFPLYTMVSFTDIEYITALMKGNEQEMRLKEMIAKYHLQQDASDHEIDEAIHLSLENKVVEI